MMKAMFAAIAGLQNHITYMDVVGNNIANVNTTAFKAGRITFQDMLTQTIAGASAPTVNRGRHQPGAGRPRNAARQHRRPCTARARCRARAS